MKLIKFDKKFIEVDDNMYDELKPYRLVLRDDKSVFVYLAERKVRLENYVLGYFGTFDIRFKNKDKLDFTKANLAVINPALDNKYKGGIKAK